MIGCEACGSKRWSILLDNLSHRYKRDNESVVWKYRLLQCEDCGLGFIDPKPERELISTFYESTYGCYKADSKHKPECLKYWIAKQRYAHIVSKGLLAFIRAALGIIIECITGKTITYSLALPLQLPKNANIFEFGYGSGNWLVKMHKSGYRNLFGYDIDANAANKARLESEGIKVSSGLFSDNEYPPASFDCIRAEHVYEHLLSPIEVLSKCRKMLKPSGWMLINIPSKDSWSMGLSPRHYAHLDTPRHIYHHTRHSISRILKAAGFDILKVKSYSVATIFAATVNNILFERYRKRIPAFFFIPLAWLYRLIGIVTGKGDNITIWARRNPHEQT